MHSIFIFRVLRLLKIEKELPPPTFLPFPGSLKYTSFQVALTIGIRETLVKYFFVCVSHCLRDFEQLLLDSVGLLYESQKTAPQAGVEPAT